jgi:molecular chaperone DnaJ/curved DNA-binding protein
VKIPAGIDDGKKIRLRGQGEPSGSGGSSGDLLITVRVESHPFFQRRGRDLEVRVPISLLEAVRGAKVDIPTPQGTISLTVPPLTSGGKRLRVRGHGVPGKEGTGDLIAEIQIRVPDKNTAELLSLLEKLERENPSQPRDKMRW